MQAEGVMQAEAVAEVVISILRTQLKYLVTDIIYDNEDSNFYFPTMDLLIVYNDLFLYVPTFTIYTFNRQYIVNTTTQLHYDTTYNTTQQ